MKEKEEMQTLEHIYKQGFYRKIMDRENQGTLDEKRQAEMLEEVIALLAVIQRTRLYSLSTLLPPRKGTDHGCSCSLSH